MRTIARFMDARNTAEGKFLSVLLSVLLVEVTMFTDYAGADTTPEGDGTEIVTPLEDVEEPEAQPEDTPGEPEKETKSLMEGGEGEGSPEQEQPESEEPAGEVNETEEKEADVPNANKGADESGANSKGIVARSQTLAAETKRRRSSVSRSRTHDWE